MCERVWNTKTKLRPRCDLLLIIYYIWFTDSYKRRLSSANRPRLPEKEENESDENRGSAEDYDHWLIEYQITYILKISRPWESAQDAWSVSPITNIIDIITMKWGPIPSLLIWFLDYRPKRSIGCSINHWQKSVKFV